jgi:hypothetical protein
MSDAPGTEGLTTSNLPDVAANSIGSGNFNQSQPSAATPPAPAQPAAVDPLGELPADRAVFDRGYVDSVRREAQRYRDEARTASAQAQTYTEVFGQYDDADRGVWLDLARTWQTDPAKAAGIMQQIAENVLGEAGAGTGSAGASGPGDPSTDDLLDRAGGDQLTPEKIQELIDAQFTAREAKQAEAKLIDDIYGEIRTAGFDPESAEGFSVLYNANHFTNGNIPEAIKMTNAYKQQIIDEYVQGRSSGRVAMPTSGNGVQATQTGEPITNLEDAKRATDAFLRERRNAS